MVWSFLRSIISDMVSNSNRCAFHMGSVVLCTHVCASLDKSRAASLLPRCKFCRNSACCADRRVTLPCERGKIEIDIPSLKTYPWRKINWRWRGDSCLMEIFKRWRKYCLMSESSSLSEEPRLHNVSSVESCKSKGELWGIMREFASFAQLSQQTRFEPIFFETSHNGHPWDLQASSFELQAHSDGD